MIFYLWPPSHKRCDDWNVPSKWDRTRSGFRPTLSSFDRTHPLRHPGPWCDFWLPLCSRSQWLIRHLWEPPWILFFPTPLESTSDPSLTRTQRFVCPPTPLHNSHLPVITLNPSLRDSPQGYSQSYMGQWPTPHLGSGLSSNPDVYRLVISRVKLRPEIPS